MISTVRDRFSNLVLGFFAVSSQPIAAEGDTRQRVARVQPQSSNNKQTKLPTQPVKSQGRPKSSKGMSSNTLPLLYKSNVRIEFRFWP